MSIGLWAAVTLVLGVAEMSLCYLFLKACERKYRPVQILVRKTPGQRSAGY
jgi:hypothetical protein